MIPSLTIDLAQPPEKRWQLSAAQCEQARELLAFYRSDLALSCKMRQAIAEEVRRQVPSEYWAEFASLGRQLNLPVAEVAILNCYYDSLKVSMGNVFACTAFAVENANEILHARNLDWWTENGALSRFTTICRFIGGPQGEFTVVGWPGFTGVYSGIAPGRFAVTLNAVVSSEAPQSAMPVEFLLRRVLEHAATYSAALRQLCETPIPCDCLLLLTGVKPGEMAVIERTPNRFAVRPSRNGFVCATNEYQKLNMGAGTVSFALSDSCCGRYQRTESLVKARRPQTAEDCFAYLGDSEVRMSITAQQMVFSAATGRQSVRLPG